jgi:glucose-6-phosphate-specific signal transduction histidine kinase
MSSNSKDDDPVMRSSTERYDRVGADLDWFIILASASSIFFGFLLNITVNPTSYFTFLDNVILLAALYAVTIATVMFILPVIFHASHYRKFDVERFLLKAKESVLMGIICVMLAMYLGLGLALDSKLSVMIAYGLPSLPFIFFFIEFFRHMRE